MYKRQDESSLLSDGEGELSGSTPRPPATKSLSTRPRFADLDSPYEKMRREMKKEGADALGTDDSDTELVFQQRTPRLPDMSMNEHSSMAPHEDEDDEFTAEMSGTARKKNLDPLLHRVLDKNYRVQATPLKGAATGVSPIKWRITAGKAQDAAKGKEREAKAAVPSWQDSPMSSPEMAIPQLRSAAFMSPVRSAYRTKISAARDAPRTPGVSVQTPATGQKSRDVYADAGRDKTDEITWDSDSDEGAFGGMSPPKTIQFAVPASKLLQTPGKLLAWQHLLFLNSLSLCDVLLTSWAAREASKRIVDDILLTAGEELDESSEYSPTVVKMNPDILDDTF